MQIRKCGKNSKTGHERVNKPFKLYYSTCSLNHCNVQKVNFISPLIDVCSKVVILHLKPNNDNGQKDGLPVV